MLYRERTRRRGLSKGWTVAIIVVLGLAGLGVWLVHVVDSIKAVPDSAAAAPPLPDVTMTPGPGDEFMTYTNNKIGFSIAVPNKVLSPYGSQCGTSDVVADGSKVPSANGFIPASGVVPATILTDAGGIFYITETSTYQPGGSAVDSQGHHFNSECLPMDTKVSQVRAYEIGGSPYVYSVIAVSVTTAHNESEIAKTASKIFGNSVVAFKSLARDTSGKWQNVSLDCSNSAACKSFKQKYAFRYYEAQHKLVYLTASRDGRTFEEPSGNGFYDQQIFDSFKLTK